MTVRLVPDPRDVPSPAAAEGLPRLCASPALVPRPAGLPAAGYGLVIGGEEVEAAGGATAEVCDPATGEVLSQVAVGDGRDVDRAVAATRRAWQDSWRFLPGFRRADHLRRLATELDRRGDDLAVVESLGAGTPVTWAREVEARLVAARAVAAAGRADRPTLPRWPGSPVPSPEDDGDDGPGPFGVVAVLPGDDAPLRTLAEAVLPALAAGNGVVVLPSRRTPLTALFLAGIARDAGLPAGLLGVVPAADDDLAALAVRDGVDLVAVTGPAEACRRVAGTAAGTRTAMTARPVVAGVTVLYRDAPLDDAVEGVVGGVLAGHALPLRPGPVLLVQESVADEVLDRLRWRMTALRVGDPLDRNTDLGPMTSATRRDRTLRRLDAAVAGGAGRWSPAPPPGGWPERGCWLPPTLVTDLPPDDPLTLDATGGPVLVVRTFRTPEECLALAGGVVRSRGAGAGCAAVWSEKGSRALWTASRLPVAEVWVGTGDRIGPSAPAPSGPGCVGRGVSSFLRGGCPPDGVTDGHLTDGDLPRGDAVPDGPARDAVRNAVRDAVAAARSATPAWDALPAADRGHTLHRVAAELTRNADRLPGISGEELPAVVAAWTGLSGWGDALPRVAAVLADPATGGDGRSGDGVHLRTTVTAPLGVVALLAPGPGSLPRLLGALALLLVIGNSCVAVAPPGTPDTTVAALTEALGAAGAPSGLVTLLPDRDGTTAALLLDHSELDAVVTAPDSRAWPELVLAACRHTTVWQPLGR